MSKIDMLKYLSEFFKKHLQKEKTQRKKLKNILKIVLYIDFIRLFATF